MSNLKRNDTFDTLKALLIFSVIIMHLMSGQSHLAHTIMLVISSFYMALFFGISGYLLKREHFTQPFVILSTKYYYRLIIPYLFAYIIFSSYKGEFISFLYPWFHMWFIPAFLLFLLYIYIIEYFNINRTIILLLSIAFTIFWISNFEPGAGNDILYYIGDKRYYYYFVFLYFGYILRNYSEINKFSLFISFIVVGFSGYFIFYFSNYNNFGFLYSLNWISFRLSLIVLVIYFSNRFTNIKIPIISDLGSITLPIYLWHVLPLLLLWNFRDNYNLHGIWYYVVYFLMLSFLILSIQKTKKTYFGKTFIIGEHK